MILKNLSTNKVKARYHSIASAVLKNHVHLLVFWKHKNILWELKWEQTNPVELILNFNFLTTLEIDEND